MWWYMQGRKWIQEYTADMHQEPELEREKKNYEKLIN